MVAKTEMRMVVLGKKWPWNKRGYDLGKPDGVIGPKTRAALMDFQLKAGLTPDGFPSGNALKALG